MMRSLFAFALACVLAIPAQAAPRKLVDAIIHVESGGKPHVVGRAGEIGLMQIKLSTARSVGFRGSRKQLFDKSTNILYGTRYLDIALRRAGGRLCHAASLYNMGVFAKPRCTAYGRRVLRAMR